MLFGGFACTPEGGEETDNNYAELTVTPASISATLEGTTETLVVTSNASWVVTCDQADVVLNTLVGKGNGTVTVDIPSATAARSFVIKFVASKMVSVAGVSVPSVKEFDVQVSQNATGTDLNDYAYYEDCGTNVEKDGSYWPYVDAFTGWNPQGEAAAAVTYGGNNASVRASGTNYQPTEDAIGLTGQPYVFLNKVPASAHFLINNIAVKGGAQYVFTFNVSCQNSYVNSLPGFAEVTNDLVHLELGYDGANWAKVNFAVVPNGGHGWYATTTEFKTKADATKLFARFTYEAPASDGGARFDDFKLVEGGNGGELDFTVTPPSEPELPEQPTSPLTLPYSESFASNQGYFTINNVVLPEALSYVWAYAAGYGMKGSAFANSTKYEAESWLVSPEISLVGATAPQLTFSHAVNKLDVGTPADWFTLHIKKSTATEWDQLTIPTHGTGTSWAFVDSGAIDLSAYVGEVVQIAFKYTSSSASAGTWEVKNVLVAEGSGSSEPEQPADGSTVSTIVFNQMGYTNAQNVDGQTITVDENISLVFKKGGASTAPAYYDASQGIRMYQNGATLDVTAANGKTITSIDFEFDYNMWYLGCDSGELSEASNSRTWTGSASAIKFTCIGTDKNSRAYIKSMKITYK